MSTIMSTRLPNRYPECIIALVLPIMERIILIIFLLTSLQDIPSNRGLWQCTMQITDSGCHHNHRDEIVRRILKEIGIWSLVFEHRLSLNGWFDGIDCVEMSESITSYE